MSAHTEMPWCHNRPDRPTEIVRHYVTVDETGRNIGIGTVKYPFFSDNSCKTWAGNDISIVDPEHPNFGSPQGGDYYPLAHGFAHHCATCRHCPAFARKEIRKRHAVP